MISCHLLLPFGLTQNCITRLLKLIPMACQELVCNYLWIGKGEKKERMEESIVGRVEYETKHHKDLIEVLDSI